MITTITAAAADIITTGGIPTLVLITVVTLLILLVEKEIASGLEDVRAKRFRQALNVVIIPLMFVFVTAFAINVIGVLH